MDHQETRRLDAKAKYAALFLHGIVGTPNQFRKLIPLESLVPESWSVINVRYPGHGGDVPGFGRSNINQWRDHARATFLELTESHEKVLIVGHSMGTLFALQLAQEFPDKAAGLFLLNVPMRPWVRFFCAVNCIRLAFDRIREDHPLESCFRVACGVTPTPKVWQYISWIPRIFELFVEIGRTEKILDGVAVPCIAWQSCKDDLVSNFSAGVLRRYPAIDVRELANSTHFYYAPQEAEILCREFQMWIKKVDR